jgi:serine/threonine-protein kinase
MAAVAAERDLLLGLLALQNGLINQSQLVAAFQSWTLEKSRPLADHLVALGHLGPAQRSVVEALAALHLEAHGGEVEKSLAAVPAGKSTLESLAAVRDPEVERTLSQVGSARPPADDSNADRTPSYAVGTASADGQRFRVLRPHARGGLGAVFVALDAELNREVALKQMLEQHADDPTSRARFLLEAEITGGLEHPGIVPIYGLGTYDRGRPFYAMRFIKGDSLKEAADRVHADESLRQDTSRRALEQRKLLGRLTDVCDAIAYAHSRGVLHRDIKPGNVIVGRYGETLVVDWGLAKATGRPDPGAGPGERTLVPSSASGSAETLPGSSLGTPAYMSPEQAEGDLEHLGPRSDVYSLGATLYYLLTGRPAFEGDLHEMIRAVQRGEFPPPRRLDPAIDPALEAVCKKAMAHRPGDRYASPKALSEDIERWMADEPVSAWREPMSRRARRWANRNRTAASSAAVALVAGVVGLAAVLAVQTRSNAALKAANNDLAAANAKVTRANADLAAANGRERARFALAQEAIRTFHSGVSEDVLLKQEEFKVLRTKLLQGARDFYRKLEALLQDQTDRESRLALARAYNDVGELSRQLDSIKEAEGVQRRALALFEDLVREDSSDVRARLGMARTLGHLRAILYSTGRRMDSLAALMRALDLLRTLAEEAPSDQNLRVEWARAEISHAASLIDNRPDEALVLAQRAREILDTVAEADAPTERGRSERVELYGAMAMALKNAGRIEEGLAAYREACATGEALVRANPDDPQIAHELARNLGNMGLALGDAGRHVEAIVAFDRALEVLKLAAKGHPTLIMLRATTAWIETARASSLDVHGRHEEALESLGRARVAREALIKANPAVIRNREQLVRVHYQAAAIHRRAGRMEQAVEAYKEARRVAMGMIRDNPAHANARSFLSWADAGLANHLNAMRRPIEALNYADEAVEIGRRIVEADRRARESVSSLASAVRERGIALKELGRPADAASALREAIALNRGLENPEPVDIYDIACCFSLLSTVFGDVDSGATADEAMATLQRAIVAGYREPAHMRQDTDLDPIRSRPDFRALMLDLEFPANPFALGR